MTLAILPIKDLASRHYGLTQALASAYLEALSVTLDRLHAPPQVFVLGLDELNESTVILDWPLSDHRMQAAWANTDDATRDGAYAAAIAAAELICKLFTVRRSEKLTGADYYLFHENREVEDLEDCIRLEVSGTTLDLSAVKQRLKNKVKQTQEGFSDLPAIAIVVGFGASGPPQRKIKQTGRRRGILSVKKE